MLCTSLAGAACRDGELAARLRGDETGRFRAFRISLSNSVFRISRDPILTIECKRVVLEGGSTVYRLCVSKNTKVTHPVSKTTLYEFPIRIDAVFSNTVPLARPTSWPPERCGRPCESQETNTFAARDGRSSRQPASLAAVAGSWPASRSALTVR